MSLYAVKLADGAQFDVALAPSGPTWHAEVAGQRFQMRLLGACHQDGILVEINGRQVCLPMASQQGLQSEVDSIQVALPKPTRRRACEESIQEITSPIAGIVLSAMAAPGQRVKRGEPLFVIEAMKMENVVCAGRDGVFDASHCRVGEVVRKGQPIARLTAQAATLPARTHAPATPPPRTSLRSTMASQLLPA